MCHLFNDYLLGKPNPIGQEGPIAIPGDTAAQHNLCLKLKF